MRLSITMRLALAFALVWLLATAAILGAIWWQASRYLDRTVDRLIATDVQGLSDLYRSDGLGGLLDTIRARVLRQSQPDALYAVLDPQGRRLVGNLDAATAAGLPTGWSRAEVPRGAGSLTARVYATVVPEGFGIVVGRDVSESAALRASLIEALGSGALLALAVAGLSAWAFRWLLRRRLDQVATTAHSIMGGDLAARVAGDGSGDAFDRLAATINAMLDRIQVLMEGLRQVSNEIAHDLRTPLASLRATLERLAEQLPEGPPRQGVQEAIAETDEILRIFEALLRIATIDARANRSAFAPLDLAQVVRNVAEIYGPLAEDGGRQIAIDSPPKLVMLGDRQLLAQALANLVDNALEHGAGAIEIALAQQAADIVLTVADRGPGVPEAERERVLQRFHRGDPARSGSGAGLGLALAASVARLHEGSIQLEDNQPGLRVVIRLPAREQRTEDRGQRPDDK